MSAAELANTDFSVTITPQDGATAGTPSYVTIEAASVSAPDGKKVLVEKIVWTVVGCSNGSYTGGTTDPQSMDATAEKMTCNTLAPMRKGDNGMCSGVLAMVPSGTKTCSCKFEITDAGQSKVKGV